MTGTVFNSASLGKSSMKKFLLILFVLSNLQSFSQNGEKYNNYFGSSIDFIADGSFFYSFRFDLVSQWAVGTWTGTDTLTLTTRSVYDTIAISDKQGKRDSLVLSYDPISSRISADQYREDTSSYIYSQQDWILPIRLVKKKNKLYNFMSNGKLVKGKERGMWGRRKFPLNYVRQEDK